MFERKPMTTKPLILFISLFIFASAQSSYALPSGKQVTLTPIEKQSDFTLYRKQNGQTVMLKDTLFVVLKEERYLSVLLADFPLRLVKRYDNVTYLLRTENELLDIISEVAKATYVKTVQLNTYQKVEMR